MAVRVRCDEPEKLLKKIKAAVGNGTVETWQLDADGDFTHTPQQWLHQAWFRPSILNKSLVFNILGQASKQMSTPAYAVYHGRFIEMLLAHFDEDFSDATATALPEEDDFVGEEP
jgi:hypothetical protein